MGVRRGGRHDAGISRRRQVENSLHRRRHPRRNAAGEITNAVVVNSYYSGDSADMYEQWVKGAALSGGVPIIGAGRPIDTDRYYVVMVDPLGTWGASKPSDGLGTKFPQYSYYDMVQANYRTGENAGLVPNRPPVRSRAASRTSVTSITSRSATR